MVCRWLFAFSSHFSTFTSWIVASFVLSSLVSSFSSLSSCGQDVQLTWTSVTVDRKSPSNVVHFSEILREVPFRSLVRLFARCAHWVPRKAWLRTIPTLTSRPDTRCQRDAPSLLDSSLCVAFCRTDPCCPSHTHQVPVVPFHRVNSPELCCPTSLTTYIAAKRIVRPRDPSASCTAGHSFPSAASPADHRHQCFLTLQCLHLGTFEEETFSATAINPVLQRCISPSNQS